MRHDVSLLFHLSVWPGWMPRPNGNVVVLLSIMSLMQNENKKFGRVLLLSD